MNLILQDHPSLIGSKIFTLRHEQFEFIGVVDLFADVLLYSECNVIVPMQNSATAIVPLEEMAFKTWINGYCDYNDAGFKDTDHLFKSEWVKGGVWTEV